MSNYRDDTQETLRIHDVSFAKVSSGDTDHAKISDSILSKIINRFDETLVVSDYIQGLTLLVLDDHAHVSEQYSFSMRSKSMLNDSIKVSDQVFSKFKTSLEESVVIRDELHSKIKVTTIDLAQIQDQILNQVRTLGVVQDTLKIKDQVIQSKTVKAWHSDTLAIADSADEKLKQIITDHLTVFDQILTVNTTKQLITDSLKAKDQSILKINVLLHDQLVLGDAVLGNQRFKELLQETLLLSDQVIEISKPMDLVQDNMRIIEDTRGFKKAVSQSNDTLFIEDEVLDDHRNAVAWSSTSQSWDMSRYDSFDYEQLVVINDTLYGITENGIEHLDYGHAEIGATVVMPKIDISGGSLAHPLGMYFEYSLEGDNKSLIVDVGTTQSGDYKEYKYTLPGEQSAQLTNGRILFGRGLRGRHFNFTINMIGKQGYINDLSIDIAQTKRRI